jgi:hypothetical protein
MLKKRNNPAERLRDVLELVYARRYSGLLSAERFSAGHFEEGEIYFEFGRPIYARCGSRTERGAFAWLSSWRQIYFSFERDAPHPVIGTTLDGSAFVPNYPEQRMQSVLPFPYNKQLPVNISSNIPFSGLEQMVPHKRVIDRNVLALPLTRVQRAAYLLVDGRRTIADLARCMGKNVQEIRQLLSELQEQDLILI